METCGFESQSRLEKEKKGESDHVLIERTLFLLEQWSTVQPGYGEGVPDGRRPFRGEGGSWAVNGRLAFPMQF